MPNKIDYLIDIKRKKGFPMTFIEVFKKLIIFLDKKFLKSTILSSFEQILILINIIQTYFFFNIKRNFLKIK